MSEHLGQLFSLLYHERKIDELYRAVEQTRERMEQSGEGDLWRFWLSVVLSAQGRFEEADIEINKLNDELRQGAYHAFILERARLTKDWAPVIEFFQQRWHATKAPVDLLGLCEAHLENGAPLFVAENARALVQSVGTTAALRLAVTGATQAKNWKLALELLTENGGLFPNGKLPADLRRIRVMCEQSSGLLNDATRDAEELVEEEANAENLSLLFQLHVAQGDLKRAALPARRLVHSQETPPATLVQVAAVMRLEDRTLATQALHAAVARNVHGPETVGLATTVAAQLSQDSLMRQLIPKMAAEAAVENSTLRRASLHELLEFVRSGQEQKKGALEDWRLGKLPIHILYRITNVPLATWSVVALSHPTGTGDLSRGMPVFFRHGGRQTEPPARKIGRLYVDITALHISHELGILPLIEEAFGPLYLSASGRLSLVTQADAAAREQPNLVAARVEVGRLLDAAQIEVWTPSGEVSDVRHGLPAEWWQAVEEAKRTGGLLVDCWPKLMPDDTDRSPPLESIPTLTSAVRVLDTLEQLGKLEAFKAVEARRQLANLSRTDSEFPTPKEGQRLFLEGNIAEQFAALGILEIAATNFRLVMTAWDAQTLRNEIARSQTWERVTRHLQGLREHVVASQSYREVPLRGSASLDHEFQSGDPSEQCLSELMHAENGEGHFIWTDDRFINAHANYGEIPIITTIGIIEELNRAQKLDPNLYHALRHRLRVADFRYVPVTSKELTYHLFRAPIHRGQITETPELAVLRRYAARVFLDHSALQIPPLNFKVPNPNGETDVPMSFAKASLGALAAVFENPTSGEDAKYAQADWILQQFWIEPSHFGVVLGRPPLDDINAIKLDGIGDGMLLARAINRKDFGESKGRKLFFNWLGSRLLTDSRRVTAAATQVRFIIERTPWRNGSKLDQEIKSAIIQDWFLSLPKSIRDQANLTDGTRKALSITSRRGITIGDAQFDPNAFWMAAESACAGNDVTLRAFDDGPEFKFSIVRENERPVLTLQRQGQDKPLGLSDEVVSLMDRDAKRRLDVLRAHPEWFDGFGGNAKKEMDRIARLSSAAKRAAAVNLARSASAWHHYKLLEALSHSAQGPTLEQMKPLRASIHSGFLRLPKRLKSGEFKRALEKAAIKLIAELGLLEAFTRLMTLPVEMPSAIREEFCRTRPSDRDEFLTAIIANMNTPLARIHTLRFLLLGGDGFRKQAAELAASLLNEEQVKETTAMIQVVSWVWYQLGFSSEPPIEDENRLAVSWAHGSRLFAILRGISGPADVERFFANHVEIPPSEMLARTSGENDVSFPRRVVPSVLLVTGVSAAFHDSCEIANAFDPSLREKAAALCFHLENEAKWPQAQWLSVPELKENRIDSFLGRPREKLLASFLGDDLAAELSAERMYREIDTVLSTLEDNSKQDAPWALLSVLLSNQLCPPPFRKRLKALIESVDWHSLALSESSHCVALVAFANQAWELGGEELVNIIQQRIASYAGWLSRLPDDKQGDAKRRRQVMICAESLSRSVPSDHSSRTFARALIACFDQWPRLADSMPGAIGPLMRLPDRQLREVWPLILRLRHDLGPRSSTGISLSDDDVTD